MAYLTGDQASFTWTDPSGQALTEADFDFWEMNTESPPQLFRPFGWLNPTAVFQSRRLTGTLRHGVNDSNATHPIPNGTRGTLTLLQTSGQSYAFPASLFQYQAAADSTQGGLQIAQYRFVLNASTNTDTITVT